MSCMWAVGRSWDSLMERSTFQIHTHTQKNIKFAKKMYKLGVMSTYVACIWLLSCISQVFCLALHVKQLPGRLNQHLAILCEHLVKYLMISDVAKKSVRTDFSWTEFPFKEPLLFKEVLATLRESCPSTLMTSIALAVRGGCGSVLTME